MQRRKNVLPKSIKIGGLTLKICEKCGGITEPIKVPSNVFIPYKTEFNVCDCTKEALCA